MAHTPQIDEIHLVRRDEYVELVNRKAFDLRGREEVEVREGDGCEGLVGEVGELLVGEAGVHYLWEGACI